MTTTALVTQPTTKTIATSIPQANNIFRVLRILGLFDQAMDTVAMSRLTELFAQARDRGYYLNAAVETLGLVARQGKMLTLTTDGQKIHALQNDTAAACNALRDILMVNPYFKAVSEDWAADVLAGIVAKDERLSMTTAARRMHTFVSWYADLKAGIEHDTRKVLIARKRAIDDGTLARARQGWDNTKELFTTRSVDVRNFQSSYRDALIQLYGGACVLTGVRMSSLLVASHIKPVRDCVPDEAVDPCNGLLLEARFDRLFDQGLISFKGDGTLLVSKTLESEKAALGIVDGMTLTAIHDASKKYLAYHRAHVFTP